MTVSACAGWEIWKTAWPLLKSKGSKSSTCMWLSPSTKSITTKRNRCSMALLVGVLAEPLGYVLGFASPRWRTGHLEDSSRGTIGLARPPFVRHLVAAMPDTEKVFDLRQPTRREPQVQQVAKERFDHPVGHVAGALLVGNQRRQERTDQPGTDQLVGQRRRDHLARCPADRQAAASASAPPELGPAAAA